jgi:hypothetical protein
MTGTSRIRARIAGWLWRWLDRAGIAEVDPAPEYSRIDRMDGLE